MLFTFPSRYLCTIGHWRVFSLTRWFSQIPTDFHLFRGTWEHLPRESFRFRLLDFHLLRFTFPSDSANSMICHSPTSLQLGLQASHNTYDTTVAAFTVSQGLDFFRFARRYSGNHSCFLFLEVLRCFSSLRSLCRAYGFNAQCPPMTADGLPHSEIPGSKVVSTYPRLFAGSRVLHRLLVPRHPPYALSNLPKIFIDTQIVWSDWESDSVHQQILRKYC